MLLLHIYQKSINCRLYFNRLVRPILVQSIMSFNVKSCSTFFLMISKLTLSHKNNIKIHVFTHTYLVHSEFIYHCVYCMPHSSLFMLLQYKRQQSREVLRTVFVCHRVPFLIPQAPAMPGGAVCGGGSWCTARLRRFSCCSESGVGDGL